MAGFWEMQGGSVLACVIHTDHTTIAWAFGLRNLQIPGGIMGLAGMPYDHARNEACKKVLEVGAQWLFFLDSDVIPPADTILRLMRHNQPIISGLYFRRSPPEGVPVMMKPVGNWIVDFPENSVIEVDVVGAGCLLIHRSVLERFKQYPQRPGKTWFDWRVDMQGHLPREECLSEDFTFSMHAKRLGIPTLVDTSIQCRHVGLGEARRNYFRPVDTTPVT